MGLRDAMVLQKLVQLGGQEDEEFATVSSLADASASIACAHLACQSSVLHDLMGLE